MDVDAYLQRIGTERPAAPTLDALAELALAHLYSVPFENLDIAAGRRLSVELEAIHDKVVTRRRGGFCYELNGLFAGLLRALGYDVTLLAAEVPEPRDGGPRHDREGRHRSQAGGDTEEQREQQQHAGVYRGERLMG